jgi:hypothetical protein
MLLLLLRALLQVKAAPLQHGQLPQQQLLPPPASATAPAPQVLQLQLLWQTSTPRLSKADQR